MKQGDKVAFAPVKTNTLDSHIPVASWPQEFCYAATVMPSLDGVLAFFMWSAMNSFKNQ